MTAKELIEKLQQVPEDAEVVYWDEDYWRGWAEISEFNYDENENTVRIG